MIRWLSISLSLSLDNSGRRNWKILMWVSRSTVTHWGHARYTPRLFHSPARGPLKPVLPSTVNLYLDESRPVLSLSLSFSFSLSLSLTLSLSLFLVVFFPIFLTFFLSFVAPLRERWSCSWLTRLLIDQRLLLLLSFFKIIYSFICFIFIFCCCLLFRRQLEIIGFVLCFRCFFFLFFW